MTDSMGNADAQVTQADRSMAGEIAMALDAIWMSDGGYFATMLQQLLARHRQLGIEEGKRLSTGKDVETMREALETAEEALDQLLDDMRDGHSVCPAAKAMAQDALDRARTALASTAPSDQSAKAGEGEAEEWDGPLTEKEQAMIDAAWERHKAADPVCRLPPDGWSCSRGAGHYGPCAASPSSKPTEAAPSDQEPQP